MQQGRYTTRLFFALLLMMAIEISYAKQDIKVYSLDGRSTSFSLYTQQRIKELKILISRRWNIPICNMRLTVNHDEVLADDAKIESLSRNDRITVHDISSPLRSDCQYYDHPPKL